MAKDPWTDPDPQPGDFDAEIDAMDPRDIQVHEGNPDGGATVLVGVSSEDAALLKRLAQKRGQEIGEVIGDLVRSAA